MTRSPHLHDSDGSFLGAGDAAQAMVAAAEEGRSAVSILALAGSAAGRRLLVTDGPGAPLDITGSLGSSALDEAARALAEAVLADDHAGDGLRRLGDGQAGGDAPESQADEAATVEVYVEVRRPVRELVIVGAGHIAQPLCTMGALLGFQVTVVDDRPDFATRERFPEAHRLVRVDFDDPFADIPLHTGSHVLLVTRGHKYDYDALVPLMNADPPPAYIGMIGSRRRVRATFVQLLEEGIPRPRLDDIHAPLGLDIGAETPEEIAVAVAAELVKERRGGTGAALKDVARVAEQHFS
jgi:xanthine dehydrogenase accessory factor